MKILFLTGLYPIEQEENYRSLCKGSYLQNAPNVFQWNVVMGLYENKADFYVISFPFLPCYPSHISTSRIDSSYIKLKNQIIGEVVSYSTMVAVKPISIKYHLYESVRKWINNNIHESETFVVLTYTTQSYFIDPLSRLKKEYSNMRIASIVTDLVDDMPNFASNNTFLKRIQTRMEIKKVKKLYKDIDKYILLTEAMTEKIPNSKFSHIIIEGLADFSQITPSNEDKIQRSILYAGTLEEYSGINVLVDAFSATKNSENKLIICGTGTCQKYILEKAAIDNRIEFKGSLPRTEILKLQKQVSLLINPRQPNNAITRFSFPSKTIEYFSSGTPMIGYRLEGIPNEYYEFMYVVEDNSIESLQKVIEDALSQPPSKLEQVGYRAKSFIWKYKTAKVQVSKILHFLQS